MSRRARYDGPFPEVVVGANPGEDGYIGTVKRGGLLPKDAPASVRDSLLSTEDWTEVADPSGSSSSSSPSTAKKE